MCRWTHYASSHNQKKENNNLKTRTTRLPENQTVWKSNNQGVKEDTFIQTGRSWVETGSRAERTPCKAVAGGAGLARQQLVDPATDRTTQGSSTGK